jgi:RNA polymerase sigma factor (sigma-70 family)
MLSTAGTRLWTGVPRRRAGARGLLENARISITPATGTALDMDLRVDFGREADPDLELLDRWCAGDRRAGSALFDRHVADLFRFFDAKVGEETEELVQRTFWACVNRGDEFGRQSTFRTFLFAIARFELYAYWRQRARDGNGIDFADVSLADIATTPGTRLARGRERDRLLHALQSLPLESQLLIELHCWEGMDSDQLAEVFDIAPTAARTRLLRARRALRALMEADRSLVARCGRLDDWVRVLRAAMLGPIGQLPS